MEDYLKTYASRKSILLGIFLWGMLLAVAFFLPVRLWQDIPFVLTFLFILALVSVVWFGISYRIAENNLEVRVGWWKICCIPIASITSIKRSFNPLSSPAASLKRLKVCYSDGWVLISPKKEHEFLKQLRSINPNIYVQVDLDSENESILTRFVYAIL